MSRRRGLWTLSVVATVAAATDLVTKVAAITWLDEPIDLGVVTLRLVRNPGIAFGLGTGLPSWLLVLATSLVALLLVGSVVRGALEPHIGAGLVLGGAIANIIDRALDGSVVDVIDLGWWPTFNLADVFLSAGCVLLAWWSLRTPPADASRLEQGDTSQSL